jgi:hypothetical protein
MLDEFPIQALVDSGASFSVISNPYRRQLKKTMFQNTIDTPLKIADGKYVQPLGRCIIRLTVNNLTQPFEFVVLSSCSHDVILGWDFLKASQAIIDCRREELQVSEHQKEAERLCVIEDVSIPPSTLKKVCVATPDRMRFSPSFLSRITHQW